MINDINHRLVWNELVKSNPQSLLDLYNMHYLGLINYGTKLTGNREFTNDCITQVLIKLWDKRNELPEVSNSRSYLLSCLKNELVNELKKNKRALELQNCLLEADYVEISYEQHLINLQSDNATKKKLSVAFSHLTEREKELLQMKFFKDMSYDEIAARCNITKRTAYNIIHAAIKNMKGEFFCNFQKNTAALSIAVAVTIVLFFVINNFSRLL